MVEKLLCHELWTEFLEYKTSKMLLTPAEERELRDYVQNRKYLPMAEKVLADGFAFSMPEKKELNKMRTAKKRVVYCFPDDENMLLKMLSYLLYQYEDKIPDNCYSFRRNTGARKAFLKMAESPEISNLHGFKSDISNYFNSINIDLLMPILRETIEDNGFLRLLSSLLCDDRAIWQGDIIRENRGVMAGTPTSPFFANIYLKEMDEYFAKQDVLYARYSDDILIFGKEEEMQGHMEAYYSFLAKYRLASNPTKEQRFKPGDKWNFLGFDYDNGVVDISDISVCKLKDKIRRSAKSIRRWMLKNNAEPERALRAFNRKFNRKFYTTDAGRELCWCRWYFPIINTPRSLHVIDRYMQEWQRYIVTGRHNKANYKKVPYAMLRANGYQPLVSAYYGGRDGATQGQGKAGEFAETDAYK